MLYLFIFLFGLSVGSFLNCVIYRLEIGSSFLKGRSFCPYCKHTLSWQDLIPVLSFVFLQGLCRYCRQKISLQYPLVELATGTIFLLIFLTNSNIYAYAFLLLMASFLIVIFVYDLKHYIIPDSMVFSAIAAALLYQLLFFWPDLYLPFLSAIGASGFFLAIVLFSRGKWMGLGDVKLAFFMGLLLSWPHIIVALFLSFLIGAIIGLGLISASRKTIKSEIPFGPFLILGTAIAFFWGDMIVEWYLELPALFYFNF